MDFASEGDVTLKQKETPLDLSKCVICWKVKEKNGGKKLVSTENGKKSLIECLKVPLEGFSKNLD